MSEVRRTNRPEPPGPIVRKGQVLLRSDAAPGARRLRGRGSRRLLDRHAPVDAVFLGRVVPRRLVVRAAVVPDDDVAFAPAVAVFALGLNHALGELIDQRVALRLLQALDAEDLALIEVQSLASGFGMVADDGMEDGGPVAVLLVEEGRRFPAAAIGEGAPPPFEPRPDAWRQGLVCRVHAGEERVAAPTWHRHGIELGRLERLLVVRAVRVPSLRAPPIDRHVELAVRPELVDAQHSDLGMLRVACGLRGVRDDPTEAAAVAQEVLDLELLLPHHDDIVPEPGAIDRVEPARVERPDVDPADLRADLWPHSSDLNRIRHGHILAPVAREVKGRRSWAGQRGRRKRRITFAQDARHIVVVAVARQAAKVVSGLPSRAEAYVVGQLVAVVGPAGEVAAQRPSHLHHGVNEPLARALLAHALPDRT